ILSYNSVEYTDGSDGDGVRYVLLGQKKSFWIGLVAILVLMIPWYAHERLNAEATFGLPIWTWVILGALVLETLFVIYGTLIWRKRTTEGAIETGETSLDAEADD